MNVVFLCLGGNLGDRLKNLDLARGLIGQKCGREKKASSVYETEAWGTNSQKKYLNQVVVIETRLSEKKLLHRLLDIEIKMGRKRNAKNSDRIIDIDVLFYNNKIVETEGIVIPHPRLHLRRFVLEPMNEIAPDFVHPFLGQKISQLYKKCPDKLKVKKFVPLFYICIEGNIGSGKTTLAEALAKNLKALYLPEQFERNDLLPLFYSNPKSYAFPLEYSFLLSRFQHISDALKSGKKIIVSDYSIYKCLWFAKLNLTRREYHFFRKHFASLESQLQKPDLLLYLKTPVKKLMQNIETRGRSYEKLIKAGYLADLEKEYENGIEALKDIKTSEIRIGKYDRHLTGKLLRRVKKLIEKN